MLSAKAHREPGTPVVAARALTLAAGLALALAVAGCGDEDGEGGSDAPAGSTELTLALDVDGPGGEEPRTEQVSCEPRVDGSPCARLAGTDLAPLDPATPCTEIYGGPDEVTVEGTIAGEEVSATLTRANGCEIERFDRLTPVLKETFPGYEPGASLGA